MLVNKKPLVDRWWFRAAVLVLVPAVLNGVSPGTGSIASLLLWIALIVRVIRLRKAKRIQSIRDLVRTKSKVQVEISDLRERIEFYMNYKNQSYESTQDEGLVLQDSEFPIAVVSNVGLIEHRTSDGVSEPSLIDEGRFVVTDKRGVFIGLVETREFLWSKLVSHKKEPLATAVVLYLSISNRQKVAGIASDPVSINDVQQRVEFGVAVALGRQDDFIKNLENKIALLEMELQTAPISG
jgi:hypothetical protein